jgi:hypothetical protein
LVPDVLVPANKGEQLMKHVFIVGHVRQPDGSDLWEVTTLGGERIAESTSETAARELALQLNVTATNVCAAHADLHVVSLP